MAPKKVLGKTLKMINLTNFRVLRDNRCICAVGALGVAAGQRLAILGPNGSGKTTLLRVLAGLTSDYEGTCQVAVAPAERTYLHQQPYLFRGTVDANARYALRNGAGQGGREWLERLQVAHLADRSTADLSGGERRRVALARALARSPKLLLLDEPLADLDDAASALVCEALQSLTGTTILIASPVELPDGLVEDSFTLG